MNPTFVPDELVTAAKMNQLPKGVLGFKEGIASQAFTTPGVDITGGFVTFTVSASRLIVVHAIVSASITSATASTTLIGTVKEGTTTLGEFVRFRTGGTGTFVITAALPVVVSAPTAGSHTYKLSMETTAGSGTSGVNGKILVEDIGGV